MNCKCCWKPFEPRSDFYGNRQEFCSVDCRRLWNTYQWADRKIKLKRLQNGGSI